MLEKLTDNESENTVSLFTLCVCSDIICLYAAWFYKISQHYLSYDISNSYILFAEES